MTSAVDKIFFEELAQRSPTEICRRALCSYDTDKQFYRLTVWDVEYAVYPLIQKIEPLNQPQGGKHAYLDIFITHYLLKTIEIVPHQQWVSEKDLPSGAAFFRGPHEVPTQLIAQRFSQDKDAFNACCQNLDGTPLKMADAAYRFQITARIPVAVLFWDADEDFPAEAKLLFDPTIAQHLALDAIYALAVYICERLAGC